MTVLRWCAMVLVGVVAAAALTGSASTAATEPGVALYDWMHAYGATMPSSWAQTVDAHHELICHEYAIGYSNEPVGARDDYGVTVPLAESALAATGFCG